MKKLLTIFNSFLRYIFVNYTQVLHRQQVYTLFTEINHFLRYFLHISIKKGAAAMRQLLFRQQITLFICIFRSNHLSSCFYVPGEDIYCAVDPHPAAVDGQIIAFCLAPFAVTVTVMILLSSFIHFTDH